MRRAPLKRKYTKPREVARALQDFDKGTTVCFVKDCEGTLSKGEVKFTVRCSGPEVHEYAMTDLIRLKPYPWISR